MGTLELVIIGGVVLLLFGATAIPRLARSLGRAKREFEEGLKEGAAGAGSKDTAAPAAAESDAAAPAAPARTPRATAAKKPPTARTRSRRKPSRPR